MTPKETKVLALIDNFGGIDGGHHKQWLLDQIVRVITGQRYNEWVISYETGPDGERLYHWDTGISP